MPVNRQLPHSCFETVGFVSPLCKLRYSYLFRETRRLRVRMKKCFNFNKESISFQICACICLEKSRFDQLKCCFSQETYVLALVLYIKNNSDFILSKPFVMNHC
ncbi:hypothetical protein P8452_72839 [Trifolium repens]|nr:hypothetical protein P8452_72839 [Trifolium repens]